MALINENYLKLSGGYLFSEIARRVESYKKKHQEADIIKLGIGDVTLPLPGVVIEAMHRAVDEMARTETFRGYGPEQGYSFLRRKIIETEYNTRGIELNEDEIFVSDGSKCDTGNIQEIFGNNCSIALTDPVYPVYQDTNVMAGRAITYLECNVQNNFIPAFPENKADIIYLCYPNNPTGMTLTKDELKKWVDYARENRSIILYDAAYEAYIRENGIPHSIYEIEGAREVAVEFRSFSKHASFTGTRCAYTVVPEALMGYTGSGERVSLNKLWNRRQSTKFNGVSYIIQRGAEAVLSEEGKKQTKEVIDYYMINAGIIKSGLEATGLKVFGGVNAPYIWLKTPDEIKSWEFFDMLLKEVNVVGTPGVGFGPGGEGYFRLTAFGSRNNTVEAVERIKTMKFVL